MEELVDLIKEINWQVKNEIPKINQGGCGVFASKLYKELVKLGYQPKILILDGKYDDFSQKKETLNNRINKLPINGKLKHTSFAHCCLEVGGLVFDGKEVGQKFLDSWIYRYPIRGNYTIEELDLALKVGSWNSSYSRRKKNPTLNKIIKKSIKQVFV